MGRRWTVRLGACGAALAIFAGAADAAENGAGFYLLGGKVPLSAVLPSEGFYFQNDTVLYQGDLGGRARLPLGGNIAADVKGNLLLGASTLLWVTPLELLEGSTALAVSVPYGYSTVDARVTAGQRVGAAFDEIFTVGDPLVGATWGWEAGNLHWAINGLVNIPIGDYQDGELANVAFHRWGADVTAAATWLDPVAGWEASLAAGVTFNGENPATDYVTGTEFHIEASLTKFVTPVFSIGPAGYFYQQISPDSGEGAQLGGFEGRIAAVGMTSAYNFAVADRPVTATFKVFKEFAAENRPEGVAAFLSVAMPLQH